MASPYANMELAILATKRALDASEVPVRYWQWDDWWYPGAPVFVNCVDEWEMLPEAFPSGLEGVRAELDGAPFLYYMPYWCQNATQWQPTTVASELWDFLTHSECGWACEYALVDASQSLDFHAALFERYTQRGLAAFEQDFMVTSFLKTLLYRQRLDEYERWALGLGDAAERHSVPIQFCMATPSDVQLSVQMDWVTNARTSDDYALPGNLANFGGGALLAWAFGLRPSKDSFWTSVEQGSRPYAAGSNPGTDLELNAIVAATSTGPVGISDAAGRSNATLAKRTCSADGALLQPDKPLTPADRTLTSGWAQLAGGGRLWTSSATVEDATLHLALATDVKNAASLPLLKTDLWCF